MPDVLPPVHWYSTTARLCGPRCLSLDCNALGALLVQWSKRASSYMHVLADPQCDVDVCESRMNTTSTQTKERKWVQWASESCQRAGTFPMKNTVALQQAEYRRVRETDFTFISPGHGTKIPISYITRQHSTKQHSTSQSSTMQHSSVRHNVAPCSTAQQHSARRTVQYYTDPSGRPQL